MFTILIYVLVLGIMTLTAVAEGWVITVMWDWFVVPQWGVQSLPIPIAIGLALLINLVAVPYQKGAYAGLDPEEKKVKARSDFFMMVLRPFMVLGVGYVVHLFVG